MNKYFRSVDHCTITNLAIRRLCVDSNLGSMNIANYLFIDLYPPPPPPPFFYFGLFYICIFFFLLLFSPPPPPFLNLVLSALGAFTRLFVLPNFCNQTLLPIK